MRIIYLKKRLSNNILILAIILIYCLLALLIARLLLKYSLEQVDLSNPIIYTYNNTIDTQLLEIEPCIVVEEKSEEDIWLEKLSEKYNTNIYKLKLVCDKAKIYSEKHNIDCYEIVSLIGAESEFNQYAISYLGHKYGNGLMQISQIVMTEYNWMNNTKYTINDLYDIDINLEIGCWYYARLRDHYNVKDELMYMLSAYNMGPYSEGINNKYVGKVLANLSML